MKIHVTIEKEHEHIMISSQDINKVIRELINLKNKWNARSEIPKQMEMKIVNTGHGWEVTL